MTSPVIASKVANALVEDAKRSQTAGGLVDTAGADTAGLDVVLDQFRRHYGGLWVGGRLTLTSATLEFHPNAVNRVAHAGTLDIEVDVRRIEAVDVLPGFLTKIIAVRVGDKVVKVRCWGASKMADRIRAAVQAASR
jgi:hypothetical protein